MFRYVGVGIRVFAGNIFLVSLLTLTVWFPANLVLTYLELHVLESGATLALFRLQNAIQCIFGPLYIGAIIHAIDRRHSGARAGYVEALRAGLRSWGRLLIAWFAAAMWVVLGLVLMILPGIVLALRYALVSFPVVLEGHGPTVALERSKDMTPGRCWRILGAVIVFVFLLLVFSAVSSLPLVVVPTLETYPALVGMRCVHDIVFEVLTCILYVFYLDALGAPAAGTPRIPEARPVLSGDS